MPDQCRSCGGELSERFGDEWETRYCLYCGKPFKLSNFKRGKDLTHDELIKMVDDIQEILWFDYDADGVSTAEPAKEWNAETIETVAALLIDAGMKPEWVDDPAPPTEPPMNVEGFRTADEFLDRIEEINQQRAQAIPDDYSDDEDMEPRDTIEGL
jgi:hypothetical protein